MLEFKAKIEEDGRIVIPDEYRLALNLHVGDDVIVSLKAGERHLLTREQALKRARELVRPYMAPGQLLSEELIAERRREEK